MKEKQHYLPPGPLRSLANTDTPLIATCRIVEVGATAPPPGRA